jgi:hypothetical protein
MSFLGIVGIISLVLFGLILVGVGIFFLIRWIKLENIWTMEVND